MPRKKIALASSISVLHKYMIVNGKVFMSTTAWEPKYLIFFSIKLEIKFDLYFDLC